MGDNLYTIIKKIHESKQELDRLRESLYERIIFLIRGIFGDGIQIEHSPECIQILYNASAFWVSAYNDSFVLSNTVDFTVVNLPYDLDDLEELVVIEMKRFLRIVDEK